MKDNKNFLSDKLVPIAISIFLLLTVSVAYFVSGNSSAAMEGGETKNIGASNAIDAKAIDANTGTRGNSEMNVGETKAGVTENGQEAATADPSIYKDMRIKSAYTPEGTIKLFAYARNNALARYQTERGLPIPEQNTIVIGYDEARVMKKEGLFQNIGDPLYGFFGINTFVGGILAKTSSPVDDFHFLSESGYTKLEGEEWMVFVRLNDERSPKLFYVYNPEGESQVRFSLKEGSLDNYVIHNLAGQAYYPLIIGSEEARVMKSEGLFSRPGDTIKGFFGHNVVVVGIMDETGTALDRMHLTPLLSKDI